MDQPQELEVDEEHEIVERVAAIDVAKASGMVCTRVPHQSTPGKRVTKVFEVRSTANAIAELADHLVEERIERVVLESTSDYWQAVAKSIQSVHSHASRGSGWSLSSDRWRGMRPRDRP